MDPRDASASLPSAASASPDAVALGAALRAGATSARDLVEERLALIAARGGELTAIIDLDAEGARAAADAMDADRAAGRALGALAGIPMTVKDAFDVRGLRTSAGSLAGSHAAAEDAPAVARLRAAGAILLGKTNVPPVLGDYQTMNDDFGRTRSPWHPDRTPGGSSGGSAAAVAAGFAVADLGSDLGGSIRLPSAWCGLFTHRPSNGLVSKRGHLPWAAGSLLEPPYSVSGPLARSARDLELLMSVLPGPGSPASRVGAPTLPEPRIAALAGARVGLWLDDPAAPVSAEMRAAVERFADDLAAAGAAVRPITAPARGAEALDLYARLTAIEIAHSIPADVLAALPADDPMRRDLHAAWQDAEAQQRVTHAWEPMFAEFDVVIAPAAFGAAPLHTDLPSEQRTTLVDGVAWPSADLEMAWPRLANLGALPATIVPLGAGATSGMPLGLAVHAAFLDDRQALRFAALLEREGLVRFEAPPGWV